MNGIEYIALALESGENVRGRKPSNKLCYVQKLTTLGIDRLFSDGKLPLADRRNKMGVELTEAIECLKPWMKIKEWREDNLPEGIWE